MCEAGDEGRHWHLYVQDMIGFAETVLSYTEGMDLGAFVADRRTYDATLRNVQLIGEAATHIPPEVRQTYPAVPWRAVVGVRNRLAHAYLHISDGILWSIIQEAIPDLVPELRTILEEFNGKRP